MEQNKKCEAIVFLKVWTGPGSSTLPILLATMIYQLYCSDVSSSILARHCTEELVLCRAVKASLHGLVLQ
jgi:hypothetical protein